MIKYNDWDRETHFWNKNFNDNKNEYINYLIQNKIKELK